MTAGSRVTTRVTLHGFTAEVDAPRMPFARYLEVALGAYPTAPVGGQPDLRIEVIREHNPPAWQLRTDRLSYREEEGAEMAARLAEWLFVSQALGTWARSPRFVHAHAAVVATPRESILLVGRSGSGKSTTSVALAAAGLTLYTDDVALIDRESLRPLAVPRPIKLDARSRRLLRGRGVSVARRERLRESVARTALPGLPPIELPGPPLTTAIFFSETRRPRPMLRPLTGAEAVMRLIVQSTTERLDGGAPTAGGVAIVNAVRCFELEAGRLGDTVRTVLEMVGAANPMGDRLALRPALGRGALVPA